MDYLVKKQFHILVQLALSDNVFTDSEKDAIRKIGKERGLDPQDVEEVIHNPDMKESLAPLPMTEKVDFLLDSIVVVVADKKISPNEDRFIKQIAKKLGFKEQVIDFLIEYQGMDRPVLKEMMIPYLIQ